MALLARFEFLSNPVQFGLESLSLRLGVEQLVQKL